MIHKDREKFGLKWVLAKPINWHLSYVLQGHPVPRLRDPGDVCSHATSCPKLPLPPPWSLLEAQHAPRHRRRNFNRRLGR